MDAEAGTCSLCGQPAIDAHHLTGRGPDGAYLHPELTADLCHHHHETVHDVLRHQRLDNPPPADGWTPLGLVEHTLRRVAVFIAQYAIRADNPVWTQIAGVLIDCADRLHHVNPSTMGDPP